LLGLEQTDLIDVLRAQICDHRSMRADHQLHQHELLATHCAALLGLTKQQQQQLSEDLHARHNMQLAFCEKDKKHTIDKNALLKTHQEDNDWLRQQEESMSQRVDQACRQKEESLVELQNEQLEKDSEYAKNQLELLQEKLQGEHDRILRFVTETLRSNTIAENTIEMPQFVMPALTDIIPNYTTADQPYSPPVSRAPSAPKESSSTSRSRSQSSLPPEEIPPPPPSSE